MQEIRSSNPPVVNGIFDLNKSRAQHHRNLQRSASGLPTYVISKDKQIWLMSRFLSAFVPKGLDARAHQYINRGGAAKDNFYIKYNI